MPPRQLKEPYQSIIGDVIKTMLAVRGGKYPESHSDMQNALNQVIRQFDITFRPIVLEWDEIERERCSCPSIQDMVHTKGCPLLKVMQRY